MGLLIVSSCLSPRQWRPFLLIKLIVVVIIAFERLLLVCVVMILLKFTMVILVFLDFFDR